MPAKAIPKKNLSALKRARQTVKRNLRNTSVKSTLKTVTKKVETAVSSGNKEDALKKVLGFQTPGEWALAIQTSEPYIFEPLEVDLAQSIETAISNLEDKLKGEDKSAIEAALKQLNDSAIELGKAVYEATAAQAAPGGAPGGDGPEAGGEAPGSDDDVIDAEYEVKDDK